MRAAVPILPNRGILPAVMAALLSPAPVPTASPVRVSIIVLAYRHVENLTKCLESLRQHVPPDIAHETIVFSERTGRRGH